MSNYVPRLSINLTENQRKKIDPIFPWGTQKKVFGVIVDDLIALCEKHGTDRVLGAYLSRFLSLEKISKLTFDESKRNGNN